MTMLAILVETDDSGSEDKEESDDGDGTVFVMIEVVIARMGLHTDRVMGMRGGKASDFIKLKATNILISVIFIVKLVQLFR